ncbi:hypothetical protein SISNIDRAFT_471783 [Sistotremastrum niveocremeum HHB9708]|uniref:F-box domain-containing protein n=1 Tax=Sistotremastrum niveocremeum HHB9708 TaxID=1314777 RepID=A0A164M7G4_9AGAM|nr:hypothetical protein SISNIDRAFT_471783 [Sistotremastrum niveocremeum HHB9708]
MKKLREDCRSFEPRPVRALSPLKPERLCRFPSIDWSVGACILLLSTSTASFFVRKGALMSNSTFLVIKRSRRGCIDACPLELYREIFLFVYWSSMSDPSRPFEWLTLLSVSSCQQWQSIALDIKELWDTIDVQLPQKLQITFGKRCAPRAPHLIAGGLRWRNDARWSDSPMPTFAKEVKSSAGSMHLTIPILEAPDQLFPAKAFFDDTPVDLASLTLTTFDTSKEPTRRDLECSIRTMGFVTGYIPSKYPKVTNLSQTFHSHAENLPLVVLKALFKTWSRLPLGKLTIWNFCITGRVEEEELGEEAEEEHKPPTFLTLKTLEIWGRDEKLMREVVGGWELPVLEILMINGQLASM